MQETFWSSGNNPTQLAWGLSFNEVLRHFKALYLLSDKILAAASFYFESSITREVTERLQLLFERKDIVFFVDASVSSFYEHGIIKIEKSPSGLDAYKDRTIVIAHGRQLDSIGNLFKRSPYSISDEIAKIWIEDVESCFSGTIGAELVSLLDNDIGRYLEIKQFLINIALFRHKDFIWEYVHPHLDRIYLPKRTQVFIRRRLAQMYSEVTAKLLGLSLDRPEHGLITNASKSDSTLFLHCMNICRIDQCISTLNAYDLMNLKYSPEFILFKEFYFSLIESMAFSQERVSRLLPIYMETEKIIPEIRTTEEQFVKLFKDYVRIIIGRYQKKYRRPLDILLQTYSLFNKKPIHDLICKLKTDKQTMVSCQSTIDLREVRAMKDKIFVAYGRNESARKALFELLRAAGLDPYEWEQIVRLTVKLTNNGSPYIGDIIKTGFENAKAAVIFFTGDDLAALRKELLNSGDPPEKYQPQPRPNVILEAGMALGLYPDRTIIVQLGNFTVREISNLIGRHIIRIDNTVEKRKDFLQRLTTVGCDVDLYGNDWMTAGSFPAS